MANDMDKTMTDAVTGLKAAVTALEAEETRLAGELAAVQAKRKDAAKALQTLSGETPTRRRGRPRGSGAAKKPAATPAA
jgi:hypothetical protein